MQVNFTNAELKKFCDIINQHAEAVKAIQKDLDKSADGTIEAYNEIVGRLYAEYSIFRADRREAFRNVVERYFRALKDKDVYTTAKGFADYLIDYLREIATNPKDEEGTGEIFPDYGGLLIYEEGEGTGKKRPYTRIHVETARASVLDCLTPLTEHLTEDERNTLQGYIITEISKIKIYDGKQSVIEEAPKVKITTTKARPTNGAIVADKGTNLLFGTWGKQIQINGNKNTVAMERRGAKKEINAIITAAMENVEISRELSPFDKVVFNNVCAMVLNGQEVFTTTQIIQRATNNYKLRPKDTQIAEWEKSLDYMAKCFLSYDARQEAELYPALRKITYQGYLLPIESITDETLVNGNVVKRIKTYRVLDTPLMLKIAQRKRQITTYPVALLNTSLTNTQDIIILKDYLLTRLSTASNQNNRMGRTILYSSIFEYLKIPDDKASATAKKKTILRKQIETILKEWQEAGYIGGYEITKKGREFYSITITGQINIKG